MLTYKVNFNTTIRPLTYSSLILLFLNSTLAILFLLVLFMMWYDSWQRYKLNKLKLDLSSELHDEVGSLLTGLAMQAELLERNAKGAQVDQLKRIAATSRKAMLNMRDVVWMADNRKGQWMHLVDRINDFALEALDAKEISYELRTIGIKEEKISSETKKELYLIAKEAIANVVKHSNASQVEIDLDWTPRGLKFQISDNGCLSEGAVISSSGNGLNNIKMRAKRIGASVMFQQQEGFRVCVLK